ncbi:uncharacterized protein [Centruroides vittatus]|uniref:uncharacterized protein n=1 Tax=Centruroides vittatus TaxID=120091 RepID=UPI00350F47EC
MWIFVNRLILELIICLLLIGGIEPNPGPLSRSPQHLSQMEMQNRGRGRPRKQNFKEIVKENQVDNLLNEEFLQIEEECGGGSLDTTRSTKIPEYFQALRDKDPLVQEDSQYTLKSIYELLQNNFSQLNREIQGIKTELNLMKEEKKHFQEELVRVSQKMEEIETLSKNNSHFRGMFEFELDKLKNERTNRNIIIINFPFTSTDYANEINQFIKEDLRIKNISIESLTRINYNGSNVL